MFKMKKTKRIGHVKQRKNFERINWLQWDFS